METAGNNKIHEFVDFQITVYRGSRTIEIVPYVKRQCAITNEKNSALYHAITNEKNSALYRAFCELSRYKNRVRYNKNSTL